MTNFLKGFLNQYYQFLKKQNGDSELPVVRVNVMLPTKKFRGVFGTYLKIYFTACPPNIVYSDEESILKWKKNNGTCGWAWNKKEFSIFDSDREDLSMPITRLTKNQGDIVKYIKSTLSVPIWFDNKITGVLNLDSKQNVNETLFINDEVITLAGGCANNLGSICFLEGIRP